MRQYNRRMARAILAGSLLFGARQATAQTNGTFQLRGEASEFPSIASGAAIAPTAAPAGLTGVLIQRGSGVLTLLPGATGTGMSFPQGGQQSSNTSYLVFRGGSALQSLFGQASGQLSFQLRSTMNFTDRISRFPNTSEQVVDVYDDTRQQLVLAVSTRDNRLTVEWFVNGQLQSYNSGFRFASGTEDAWFGKDKILNVTLAWTASEASLALNGAVVQRLGRVVPAASYGANASLTVGAQSANRFAGFFSTVDVIDNLSAGTGTTTTPPPTPPTPPPTPAPDTTPPSVPLSLRTTNVTAYSGSIAWNSSTDNVGVTGYDILRNGQNYSFSSSPSFTDNNLTPNTTYTYQVVARDAAGNRSAASAPLSVQTQPVAVSTAIRVGPGAQYAKPCQAFANAPDGSIIEVDAAGNYDGDVCTVPRNFTIRGVNGRPRLRALGRTAQDKAIWVTQGADITIDNFEFANATSTAGNGAGIRSEGRKLTVRNSYFHDNQNGILASNFSGNELLVEYTEFGWNGSGTGYTHNIYVGTIGKFTFRYNWSHDVRSGHLVKTRAAENQILYNRLTSEGGVSDYELDMPYGGRAFVIGNLFQQGNNNGNRTIISYGVEGANANSPGREIYVVNNTIVNDNPNGGTLLRMGLTATGVWRNNINVNIGELLLNGSSLDQGGNCAADAGQFVNKAGYDYRLTSTAGCRFRAVAPGSAPDGTPLTPAFQYVHRTSAVARTGTANPGAFEN